MNQPENNTSTDKTLDGSVFSFIHLGKTLGDGLVTIGPEKANCIAEGGFAIMYKGEVNPIRYRQKLVLEGKKDPIAIFGVIDAEQKDGKFILTNEQIQIVNRVADEKVAYYVDHPEDKQLLMSVLEEKGELQNLECAVKVLKEEALKNPNTVERFRQEYAIARNILDHPNIVKCLDLFIREEVEEDPHTRVKERKVKEAFIVYELVPDAMQLGELVHRMSIATVMDVMRQTLEGIVHAHEKGIIHRDIKPSNILLTPEKDKDGKHIKDEFGNKKYIVKITDYGVAKATHTTTKGHLTGSGDQYLGSPNYMSPEQARGEARTLTTSTDMFSIGSTFYYVLTGDLPFHGDNSPQILSRVGSERPPAVLRHENPKIHSRIEDLILRLMAPDRLSRLSAVEALEEVKSIIRDQAFVSDKPTATPLRTIPEVLREIKKTDPEHYVNLGRLYAEMASLVPRIEMVPRSLRKYIPRLKKLEKQAVDKNSKIAVDAKKKLEFLHKDLSDAIERFARKNKTAQYYYDLASICFNKAHPDEGIMAQFKDEEDRSEEEKLASLYQKKAAAEKYRIKQLVERVEDKPPGIIRRLFSNPFAMAAGVLFIAGGAVAGTLLGTQIYEDNENAEFFESALKYYEQAKKDFDSGDLDETKSRIDQTLSVYDQISKKDYNEGFEREIDEFKKLVDRAIQDLKKEKQMIESFLHLDTLIGDYKFSEAKEILDNAERIMIELGSTPYQPLKDKLAAYKQTLDTHRSKIKDKEDDIDDMDTVEEKLAEIQKELSDRIADIASEKPQFFSKKDFDTLKGKVDRYKIRLDYDIVRENVNPKKYDQTFLEYIRAQKHSLKKLVLESALRQSELIESRLQEIKAGLAYLGQNYGADNAVERSKEVDDDIAYIVQRIQNIRAIEFENISLDLIASADLDKVKLSEGEKKTFIQELNQEIEVLKKKKEQAPGLSGLEQRLETLKKEYEPILTQVSEYVELKKKVREGKDKEAAITLGKYYFERSAYQKAEEMFRIAEGDESIKPYLSIIGLEKKIKDPANLTYRVLESGYSSDNLSQLQAVIQAYKGKGTFEESLVSALQIVSETKVVQANLEDLKKRHDELYQMTEERNAYDNNDENTKAKREELDTGIEKIRTELFSMLDTIYEGMNSQLQAQKPRPRPETLAELARLYEGVGMQEKADQYYSLASNSGK